MNNLTKFTACYIMYLSIRNPCFKGHFKKISQQWLVFLLYHILPLPHHLFIIGKDNVDNIYPTAGKKAFNQGKFSFIIISHKTATIYVPNAIDKRRVQLVSHALSNSTFLFRSFISSTSFKTSSDIFIAILITSQKYSMEMTSPNL